MREKKSTAGPKTEWKPTHSDPAHCTRHEQAVSMSGRVKMPQKIEAAPEELVAGDGLHAGRVTAREHELGEQGAVNKIPI
jgi:hypothetical protein